MNNGAPHRLIAEQFERSPSAVLRHQKHIAGLPEAPGVESSVSPITPTDNPSEALALTLKQRDFCLAIAGEAKGNGTEACRLAGYEGNDAVLGVIACENLKKPKIQEFIRQLRVDAETKASDKILSATEVLVGLTKFAQADPADVFESDGSFNLQKARERGVSHLIKSVNFDKDSGRVTRVELHNAHAAHVDLGKHHKLFTDKVESNVSLETREAITPEERATRILELIEIGRARARANGTTGAPVEPAEPAERPAEDPPDVVVTTAQAVDVLDESSFEVM